MTASEFFVAVDPVLRFPLGVLAGAVATLAMDAVMPRLSEGETPPKVASGVLTSTHPDESPEGLSTFVHYFAGVGTGALYVYLSLVADMFLGSASAVPVLSFGAFLYIGMVGFFAFVPLRLSKLSEERKTDTLRDWSVCALVYVAVLLPALSLLSLWVEGVL